MSLVTRRYAFPTVTAAEEFLSDLASNVGKLETHAIFAPEPDGTVKVLIVLTPEQLEHAPNFASRRNGTIVEEAPPPAKKEESVAKKPEAKSPKKTEAKAKDATPEPASAKDKYANAPRCPHCRQPYLDVDKHVRKRHPGAPTPPAEDAKVAS